MLAKTRTFKKERETLTASRKRLKHALECLKSRLLASSPCLVGQTLVLIFLCFDQHDTSEAVGHTYLFLARTQRLPFFCNELGGLGDLDALEVSRSPSCGGKEDISIGGLLYVPIVVQLGSVARISSRFQVPLELLPQKGTRVVGESDLIGSVAVDPGEILNSPGRCFLIGKMVVMLCSPLAQTRISALASTL